jgi:hypothetical protein
VLQVASTHSNVAQLMLFPNKIQKAVVCMSEPFDMLLLLCCWPLIFLLSDMLLCAATLSL